MLTGPTDNTPAAGSADQMLGKIDGHMRNMLGLVNNMHGRPRPHPTVPKVDGVNGQPPRPDDEHPRPGWKKILYVGWVKADDPKYADEPCMYARKPNGQPQAPQAAPLDGSHC